MDTTDMRTTIVEDRKALHLLIWALRTAYEAGIEGWAEDDAYDEVKLWDEILAVIGAST